MVFTKDDKLVIKFLREILSQVDMCLLNYLLTYLLTKRYGAKRFLSEFPTKPWSLSGRKRLIKKIDDAGSTEWATGAGRPHTVRCDDNIKRVEQLALSQEDKPGTHSTQRAALTKR